MTWTPERQSWPFWPKPSTSTSGSHGRDQETGKDGSTGLGPCTANRAAVCGQTPGPLLLSLWLTSQEPASQPGLTVTHTQRPGYSCFTQPQQLPLSPWSWYSLPSHPGSPSEPSGCNGGWQIRLPKGGTTEHALCAPPHRTVSSGCPPIGIQEAWSKPTCMDEQMEVLVL